MSNLDLFLHGAGILDSAFVQLPSEAPVKQVIVAAVGQGVRQPASSDALAVFLEESDQPLALGSTLSEVGINSGSHLHVGTCTRVMVTVNYNNKDEQQQFPGAATIERVTRWAVGPEGFKIPPTDRIDWVLQICDSSTQPHGDTHVGSLVQGETCKACFDLVPKVRVQGYEQWIR